MIILDRSGRDLTRRPPPFFRPPRAALLALALAALLAGAGHPSPRSELAAPPATVSQPGAGHEPAAPGFGDPRTSTPI